MCVWGGGAGRGGGGRVETIAVISTIVITMPVEFLHAKIKEIKNRTACNIIGNLIK